MAPSLVAEILATHPTRYIEPFLGGGAVALALPRELPKLLVDVHPHLIDCWLCVQKIPGALFAELREVEHAYGDLLDGYLKARAEFNTMVGHPRKMWARRSALFIFLNARCFNGLWRTNSRGEFNVPFAKRPSPRQISADDLNAYTRALERSTIVADSYVLTLSRGLGKRLDPLLKRGDVEAARHCMEGVAIYCDPPYDGTFGGYAKDGFDDQDQITLATLLGSYAMAGAAVWTTNADTKRIRTAYNWAQIEEIDERHIVGSKAERRGKRSCLLIRGGAAIR